jgi:hypothetical protein
MKENRVSLKGKSFAECMVHYAREDNGGRDGTGNWKSFTMKQI